MNPLAGRWDDYTLGVAIERHGTARYDAIVRSEAIDEEIARLKAEQVRLGELACRHHNAETRLSAVRANLRKRAA